MKKLIKLLVVFAFLLVVCSCSPKRYDEYNISDLYDKEWIVGKSREQIEDKYGEFKREYLSDSGENVGVYYVNYQNRGIDPSYIHDSFFVIFDNEGISIDAYFKETSIGG